LNAVGEVHCIYKVLGICVLVENGTLKVRAVQNPLDYPIKTKLASGKRKLYSLLASDDTWAEFGKEGSALPGDCHQIQALLSWAFSCVISSSR
jgi:hypothetical protein